MTEEKTAPVSKDILLSGRDSGSTEQPWAPTLGNNILPPTVTALMPEMDQRLKSQQKAEPPVRSPTLPAAVGRAQKAGPSSPTRRTTQTTQVAFCSSVSDP